MQKINIGLLVFYATPVVFPSLASNSPIAVVTLPTSVKASTDSEPVVFRYVATAMIKPAIVVFQFFTKKFKIAVFIFLFLLN